MSQQGGRPGVLQVVLSLAPGGTERLVVELVKRTSPDISSAVCCLDSLGAWGTALQHDGVRVTCVNRQPGFQLGLGQRIAAFAADVGACVLHCHQYSPFVYGAMARLSNPRLRVVFTEHGRLSDAPPSRKRRLANTALRLAPDAVYAVSHDLKRHIVAEGFGEHQVGVIYNGIDIGPQPTTHDRAQMRRALGLGDDVFVVGTVARLDPVKDLGTLIHAVADVNRARPARLLVVGDGTERGALERAAHDADGGAATHFLGHRDDARAVLTACDAFANSSISEGVSLTILEAMAASLPVVATAVGGTPEVVDASCARLVPARDVGAMAAALQALAADEGLRRSLGAEGRSRVETRFTLDRMVGEYRDAYLRAAAH